MASKCGLSPKKCIDFTYLNKACKKDPFSLPRIDASVGKATGCKRFSLLDCFSGYHQIWMNKEDEEKTSFTTPSDTYYFVRMPEGLKNAGSTFTRMTKVVLGPQLQKNIIAYVYDIVVMSKREENHIEDLKETFGNLRAAGLKLNLEKCVFGVSRGKMLGCIIGPQGIYVNPDKMKAILSMIEPST